MTALEKVIKEKEDKVKELRAKVDSSNDLTEVRGIGVTLTNLEKEIRELREEMEANKPQPLSQPAPVAPLMDAGVTPTASATGDTASTVNTGDTNSAKIPDNAVKRGDFKMENVEKREVAMLDSMEYRNAFANYVRTGKWDLRDSTAGEVITTDVGKIIPNTIMNEFIKELKDYGRIYARVRKINVKGGVQFPIEELVPTVSWITETTVSDNQSAPELKTSVQFGYHIVEARIAQSLLSEVVALPVLEKEIAKLLSEAFIKEFDNVIINGSGSGQPLGVVNDSRVASTQKITMTASELADWTTWRKKLFALMPITGRGTGIMLMTAYTWETYMMTLKDNANRPLYEETYNPTNGQAECRFAGREVILVENDILSDFSDANTGKPFCIYFNPQDYVINSNLQLGFKRYFNEDTNKYVNKGLCIMDGKLLDTTHCYIVSVSA